MHRQNRLEPQQDLSCLSIAGGYVYSSKQKWTGACFPVPRARLLLAQLNSLPCILAKQGCLVPAVSWESPWPMLFPSAGAGSGHNWWGAGNQQWTPGESPAGTAGDQVLLGRSSLRFPSRLSLLMGKNSAQAKWPHRWSLCHQHSILKSWKMRKQPCGLVKDLTLVCFLHPRAGCFFTLGTF